MRVCVSAIYVLAVGLALGLPSSGLAQVPESTRDLVNTAIPYPFVHLVHSRQPEQEGGTAWLRSRDLFLFYQLGRDLVHRQFQRKHGLFGQSGSLSVPLYAGDRTAEASRVARFGRDHAGSCGSCHSIPYREPGGGQTIHSTSSMGRNTPHFYGAGLVEMIGEQVRAIIMNSYDRNRNGYLERDEVAQPSPVHIVPAPGATAIDFGSLTPDEYGIPRLNPIFRIQYFDRSGRPLPDAVSLHHPRAASFDISMQVFGWGRGYRIEASGRRIAEGGEAAVVREFYAVAADVHMGLQAHDPTLARNATSLNGARQTGFVASPDLGLRQTITGLSVDDPDGDGHYDELSAGDLDAIEFYMLHAPRPAALESSRTNAGREVFRRIGCVRCHVENWVIARRGAYPGATGDRRLFRLDVRSRTERSPTDAGGSGRLQLVGRLVRQYLRIPGRDIFPVAGAFEVKGIYSDFKHWDLGPAFHERRFDGSRQRVHRTAPLWGVGSTAPYGHGGQFQTLGEVIAAHAGSALAERDHYLRLAGEHRQLLMEFLRSLVLYSTDTIPADIDGDCHLARSFRVAGQDVGYERFDARFLFAKPPRYHQFGSRLDPQGRRLPLQLLLNVHEIYSMGLFFRSDMDGDGFPNVVDPQPFVAGI